MLIDFLTECASIVKVSSYTNVSSSLLTNNYTIKELSDIQSFNLTSSSVSSLNFTFLSSSIKNLKEIILDFTGAVAEVKFETSIDYINWYELEYKTDNKYLYKKIGNQLINLSTYEPYTGTDILNYEFTQVNSFNNEKSYIYTMLEWKFLKITFNGITNTNIDPLFITNLQIIIDDNISTEIDGLLDVKSSMFTKSKIFEEDENYTFIPDMFNNYLKMIEDNNTTPDSISYTNVNLNLTPSVSAGAIDINVVI